MLLDKLVLLSLAEAGAFQPGNKRPPLDKLVLLSLAGAGAFQPGSKIVGYADMTALNKSNGKVATFAIRVDGTGTAATSTSA